MNPAAPNSSSALAAKPPPLVVPRPMESGRQAPPEAAIAQNPAAGLVSGAQTGTKDADPKSPRADPRFAEAKRAAELQKKLDVASATKPPASPDSPAGKQLDGGGKLAATPATPRGPDLKPPDGKARPDRRTYAIQSGDSLSLIARKYYGKDSTLFVNMIYDANRDVLRDRHALKIGQKLVIPANPPDDRPGIPAAASNSNAGQGRPVGSPRIPKSLDSGRTAKSGAPTELVAKPKSGSKGGKPVEPKARTYQVRQNDTLGKIAARLLGDSSRSDELYRLNRDRLKNKHDVSPGTVLRLPPKTASAAKGADPGRGAAASSARGA
jgi:nucleoid-associated protein YgaU